MSRRRNRRERQLANQIAAQVRPDFQRIEGRIRGTALGVGWLYRPQPPLQRRDIRVSGGTRHAIRAGGNIEVRLGGSALVSICFRGDWAGQAGLESDAISTS